MTDIAPTRQAEDRAAVTANARMRLCIANPWFYPELVGPGERFRRYGPGLIYRGVDVEVVTRQPPGLPERDTVNGIEIERMPSTFLDRLHRRLFVYRLLPRYLKKGARPQVFQFFSPHRFDLPFLLALKVLGIPTLLVFTLLGQSRGSPLRRKARDLYFRIMFGPFTKIVTSSGVMTDEVAGLGVSRSRIETIPNGVDLKRFRPADAETRMELRRRLDLAEEDEVVLCVGGVVPRKAVDVLLDGWLAVAKARPHARLVFVGEDDQPEFASYREQLATLIARLPDPGRVTFTGAVPNVEDYLRASDLFVFPSLREGMPNVVPEAMATGLASVLTPFRGLPAEFGPAGEVYGLVERTPEALAGEITRLLSDAPARREMGEKARAWVENALDVEASLDRFAQVYREMAGR